MTLINMQIHLESINNTEINTVLNLFKAAAEKIEKLNIDHWQYWKNPPVEKVEWVREGLIKDEFYFVKNNDKEIMGMVRVMDEDLSYWGKRNEKAKYVHSLVVKEQFEGKGLGRRILSKIESLAKEDGCRFLRLDADAKNPKLCKYYEKQNFQKVGVKILPISTYNLYQKLVK